MTDDGLKHRCPLVMAVGLAALLAACGGQVPSTLAPTSVPGTQQEATASPSTEHGPTSAPPSPSTPPTMQPTTEPSQAETPTPAPPDVEEPDEGLAIDWHRQPETSGLGLVGEDGKGLISSAVVFNGRYVIAGTSYDPAAEEDFPAIWTSADGMTWHRSDLEGEPYSVIEELARTDSGLVALGRAPFGGSLVAWLSTDAEHWQRVDVEGAPQAHSVRLDARDGVLLAFIGSWGDDEQLHSSAWTSRDGSSWLPATDTASRSVAEGLQAIAGGGRKLVALSADLTESRPRRRVIEAWQHTADGWQLAGELPGSAGAEVFGAVEGPRGWVALGAQFAGDQPDQYLAWVSSDAVSWQLAETAPAFGGLIELRDVIGSEAGFIATGFEWTEYGCALDPAAIRGVTWTSADGLTWRRMSSRGWQGSRIDVLLRNGRTLIGVGPGWGRRGAEGSVWTARLPAPAGDSGPRPDQPLPPSQDQGCGWNDE